MSTLLLIDGHSILHRAYHAFPKTLTTSSGELTNAVYGFTRILLTVIKKFHPEYIAVAFDTPKPTFRHQEFAPYKEQRPEMESEMASQIGRVHEVVATLNIPIFEIDGYEADDVIGTLATQATAERVGLKTLIVTDDRDLLQLVGNGVRVYMARKDEIWGRAETEAEFGLPPEKLDDYKALRGDPSDNIPGVHGIGPQKTRELLTRFGSFEEVYRNLDKIEPKTRELLVASAEVAALSKKLATIVRDAPLQLDLEECRTEDFDRTAVEKLFAELEFRSLLKSLPEAGGRDDDPQIPLL